MPSHDPLQEMPAVQKEPHKVAMTGRRLKTLAISVAVILFIGFTVIEIVKFVHARGLEDEAIKAASAPQAIDVITVGDAPSSLSLKLPGETAAWYESTIYARVDGYVGQWQADIGDHVQKGQVLATIETPDLDAQLVAAVAKLKSTEAMVEFAKSTYERWKNSPSGVVSEQERESKKADYDSAVAQLGLDQADVDRYTVLAQFKQVTAPYDGTITERRIDIGNLVTAGSTANTTPLYHIMQDDPIRVFIDVPQNAATDMKIGVPAKITADNIPERVFEGKIARTADAINSQARTLHVEIDIPNSDHALVPGLYVNVDFNVPATGLIQVPAAALVFRPGGSQVAVVDKNNKIAFHKVTIGRDNGNTVDLSSGISAGDKVALNIGNQIADGDTVTPHEATDGSPNAGTQK
jgi:RND family efflux transporter MFP subunit